MSAVLELRREVVPRGGEIVNETPELDEDDTDVCWPDCRRRDRNVLLSVRGLAGKLWEIWGESLVIVKEPGEREGVPSDGSLDFADKGVED
jgi:hypothetical protein